MITEASGGLRIVLAALGSLMVRSWLVVRLLVTQVSLQAFVQRLAPGPQLDAERCGARVCEDSVRGRLCCAREVAYRVQRIIRLAGLVQNGAGEVVAADAALVDEMKDPIALVLKQLGDGPRQVRCVGRRAVFACDHAQARPLRCELQNPIDEV